MLWDQYVFRRGPEVHELWDSLYDKRELKILYITGRGFDIRAQSVMRDCIAGIQQADTTVVSAHMLLVGFEEYRLDENLQRLTDENAKSLESSFSALGSSESISIGTAGNGEEVSASHALRLGTDAVLERVTDHTDIILDVSSLPRVIYLALMTSLLNLLVPDKTSSGALVANKVNFQVLVAEDADLDARIHAEDPSSDAVFVPGFSAAMQAESVQEWPLVWFPILGENRVNQLQQIMKSTVIPADAEICPVLPHPSRNPRRADQLLLEYMVPLFHSRKTPTSNILYVHESHPFAAYRQLFRAMDRYRKSMAILGGCRLVVTPFSSKLITIGAGLACFDMRPHDASATYRIAIPHAEPMRYVASVEALAGSRPEICSLLLTGHAYQVGDQSKGGE